MKSVIVLLLVGILKSVDERLVERGRDIYVSGCGWNIARYIS